ncbi:MAG TPA: lysine--tRNA ligase [Tepidisphaeraceae bacterium]|jgi:lysyl-tRNA synthetase class 2
MDTQDTSIYEQERRAKLGKLRDLGVDPFGGRTDGLIGLAAAKARYGPEMGHDGGPVVKVAGRIVLKRDMGKLSFLTLRDESGDLQIGLDRKKLDAVDPKFWEVRNLLDLGDLIVASGPIGVTNKGETTVWATSLSMAAKSLMSPPAKYEGLQDIEARYRQRYVDLWANPEVMATMRLRTRIVQEIRNFLIARGYTEVETPMLQPIHGGAAARPFVTQHNALDMRLYLRIAPELYLKRLLVGGFGRIFEINRNFRNEGISPRHNPEFTMLEAYDAFGNWETMAELVEEMVAAVAQSVLGTLKIRHPAPADDAAPSPATVVTTAAGAAAGENNDTNRRSAAPDVRAELTNDAEETIAGVGGKIIDLTRPWRRATMAELVHEAVGWQFNKSSIADDPHALAKALLAYDPKAANAMSRRAAGLQLFDEEEKHADRLSHYREHLLSLSPAEQLVEIYEKSVEPTLINPCFVTRVPSVIIPLAKKCADDPFFADVYELAINGQEISPGYTELNDPDVQAENFRHQVGDQEERQQVDEDFLTALKYGMPPAGGIGLGIDRLVAMLTGAESLRDVILFPLQRPQG